MEIYLFCSQFSCLWWKCVCKRFGMLTVWHGCRSCSWWHRSPFQRPSTIYWLFYFSCHLNFFFAFIFCCFFYSFVLSFRPLLLSFTTYFFILFHEWHVIHTISVRWFSHPSYVCVCVCVWVRIREIKSLSLLVLCNQVHVYDIKYIKFERMMEHKLLQQYRIWM